MRLVLSLSDKTTIDGLTVYANQHNLSDFSELWFEKVRRALDLVEGTAPRTAARLRHDIRCIVVDEVQGPDYVHAIRAIRLHGPTIISRDAARVACTLVHEATHARIASRRIPYAPKSRARHERLCTKEAARFAGKLIDGDQLADQLLKQLETPWWTDEELHKRRLEEFDRLQLDGAIGRFLRNRIESAKPRK